MKIVALTAALTLLATPVAVQAQTPAASPTEVQTTAPRVIEATGPSATQAAALGLTPAQIVSWLAGQGVTPGPVEQDGTNSYVRVEDGPLTWILFFQSCQDGVCGDLQFSVGFETRAVTPEGVNGWNRDRRFLKAFYEAPTTAGGPATAVVQYDLFLRPGAEADQLTDHLAVWRGLAPEFARLVGRPAAAAPAAPVTP